MSDVDDQQPEPDQPAEDLAEKVDEEETPPDGTVVPMEVPVLQMSLAGAPIRVGRNPETTDRFLVVGPFAVQFVLPMDQENARIVGRELTGGIDIAAGIPQKEREAADRIVRR